MTPSTENRPVVALVGIVEDRGDKLRISPDETGRRWLEVPQDAVRRRHDAKFTRVEVDSEVMSREIWGGDEAAELVERLDQLLGNPPYSVWNLIPGTLEAAAVHIEVTQ